jgi:Ran GTPase-activating protein (RanGAP) involved in mRNA processing and transport
MMLALQALSDAHLKTALQGLEAEHVMSAPSRIVNAWLCAQLSNDSLFLAHIGKAQALFLLPHLTQMTFLRGLAMPMNSIGTEGAELLGSILLKMTALEEINLEENEMDAGCMLMLAPHFSRLTRLTELILTNPIGAEGGKWVAPALAKMPDLQILNLRKCEVGGEGLQEFFSDHVLREVGIRHLAPSMAKMTALQSLDLSSNLIRTEDMMHLAPCLAKLSGLKQLLLSKNLICDDAAKLLAHHIAHMSALESLWLDSNFIRVGGITHLAPELAKMPALTCLDLADNLLANQGAMQLAPHLSAMTGLEILSLRTNGIRDKGIAHLAPHLAKLTKLWMLDLGINEFGKRGVGHLAKHVSTLSDMRELGLSGVDVRVGPDVPALEKLKGIAKRVMCGL